jgi:hypothetical protein
LDITSYDNDIVHVQLFDKDVVLDDAMGIVHIVVNQLPPGRVVQSPYNLEPSHARCLWITSREINVLVVTIFDKDIANERRIGKVEIPIEILAAGSLTDIWFQSHTAK